MRNFSYAALLLLTMTAISCGLSKLPQKHEKPVNNEQSFKFVAKNQGEGKAAVKDEKALKHKKRLQKLAAQTRTQCESAPPPAVDKLADGISAAGYSKSGNVKKKSKRLSKGISVHSGLRASISGKGMGGGGTRGGRMAFGTRRARTRSAGVLGYIQPQVYVEQNTEDYVHTDPNTFKYALDKPLSTFSIDVDTASYSNVRRFLNSGNLPPADSVRVEELINYFDYHYTGPTGSRPFAVDIESASCPWNKDHRLVKIGIKAKVSDANERPAANLVFLIDVSGSMSSANKLPLLKQAFKLLVNRLNPQDKVAIAVYAGASGLVLDSTKVKNKSLILNALNNLQAGGSTNGSSGIKLAYGVAMDNFIKKGINRVILATDGDFNVGIRNRNDLKKLIKNKAKSGVFLSVLGFGMGNYKDSTLETLADKGNGNYAYIDNFNEARKVFSEQLTSTLFTVAKDVKIQVEFNPAKVKAYRLIGYENRKLKAEDFNNDKKDAGEIGAGHTVTVLYQVVPVGKEIGEGIASVDPLKYSKPQEKKVERSMNDNPELLTVKVRYKKPDKSKSKKLVFAFVDNGKSFKKASQNFRFAASVAAFAQLIKHSDYVTGISWKDVERMAAASSGKDSFGYRAEFRNMIRTAASLSSSLSRNSD